LLRRHGLAVPRGVLLQSGEGFPDAAADWPGFVLKAQVLEGGRGKRGLIRGFAKPADFRDARRLILPALDDANVPLLLEEAIAIAREIFVAVRVDGSAQGLAARVARYAARLPQIARLEDLTLLEINPLALTEDGKLIACDAKIVRDEAADFRHDAGDFAISHDLAERAMTSLEREAQALGFQLVETDGDVTLVTSGAGLGMMMMDLIGDHGMRAASFMDNLRGAPDETMTERLKIARALAARPAIKAIIFQTTLASRSLAERIEALTSWLAAEPLPKPLFVGIAAGHAATRKMTTEQAIAKLAALGVAAFTDPVELAKAANRALRQDARAR